VKGVEEVTLIQLNERQPALTATNASQYWHVSLRGACCAHIPSSLLFVNPWTARIASHVPLTFFYCIT
jgi:hypothetical protein